MTRLTAGGDFMVSEGLVLATDGNGNFRPLAGDHDIFDMRSAETGRRVSPGQYHEIIREMRAAHMGVMHGAHKYWELTDTFGRQIYDTIVESHRQVGAPRP